MENIIDVTGITVRKLEKGEIIQPTDFYKSTSGYWLPVPMHSIEAPDPETSKVEYVRPTAAEVVKKQAELNAAREEILAKRWHAPIKHRQKVRVTVNQRNTGWTQEAIKARKPPGTYEGVVVDFHDSHGLCYDVEFDDGTVSCYDPHEVEAIEPCKT